MNVGLLRPHRFNGSVVMTPAFQIARLDGALQSSRLLVEVLDGGLETTVQDYLGREGFLQWGIPRSGPMDRRAFQLGNQVLGNPDTAAGLEIQFIGPKLKFWRETVIALTGADNTPQVNGKMVPLWQPLRVQAGDLLTFGHAQVGARSYILFAGGLDVPLVMGSRSTFTRANLGGLAGRKLQAGDRLHAFIPDQTLDAPQARSLGDDAIPEYAHAWEISVMLGPHDDCLTAQDVMQFLETDWRVSPKSDRWVIGSKVRALNFLITPAIRPPTRVIIPPTKLIMAVPWAQFCSAGKRQQF